LGALFPDDEDAVEITNLEDTVAGENEASKAKLKLKRLNERNTVCYILRNNVAPGLKSTLSYGGNVAKLWDLLKPHKELFTLHDIDSRIMNLKIKDFTTGLDLINGAIRLYRPVELNDDWKQELLSRKYPTTQVDQGTRRMSNAMVVGERDTIKEIADGKMSGKPMHLRKRGKELAQLTQQKTPQTPHNPQMIERRTRGDRNV
jgi:hypothetical protein